jgi:hypothetical protein
MATPSLFLKFSRTSITPKAPLLRAGGEEGRYLAPGRDADPNTPMEKIVLLGLIR